MCVRTQRSSEEAFRFFEKNSDSSLTQFLCCASHNSAMEMPRVLSSAHAISMTSVQCVLDQPVCSMLVYYSEAAARFGNLCVYEPSALRKKPSDSSKKLRFSDEAFQFSEEAFRFAAESRRKRILERRSESRHQF